MFIRRFNVENVSADDLAQQALHDIYKYSPGVLHNTALLHRMTRQAFWRSVRRFRQAAVQDLVADLLTTEAEGRDARRLAEHVEDLITRLRACALTKDEATLLAVLEQQSTYWSWCYPHNKTPRRNGTRTRARPGTLNSIAIYLKWPYKRARTAALALRAKRRTLENTHHES